MNCKLNGSHNSVPYKKICTDINNEKNIIYFAYTFVPIFTIMNGEFCSRPRRASVANICSGKPISIRIACCLMSAQSREKCYKLIVNNKSLFYCAFALNLLLVLTFLSRYTYENLTAGSNKIRWYVHVQDKYF